MQDCLVSLQTILIDGNTLCYWKSIDNGFFAIFLLYSFLCSLFSLSTFTEDLVTRNSKRK